MIYIYLLSVALFLHNVDLISSTVYSCDRTAECGCSKTNVIINKIVGGESAAESSWGWAVSLQRNSGSAFCGGTIISPSYIITAAHCVKDSLAIIRNTRVVVGIDKLSQSTLSTTQTRSVVRVVSHPEYDSNLQRNDIAILELDKPLIISNAYGTARLCLPNAASTSIANNYPVVGSSLVGVGWGTLASGAESVPSNLHLQQVTVNGMSETHRMCAPTIKDRRVQFCAAVVGGGKDTCQGDSGGPLMRFESNERRWVLAGITSYGSGCGDSRYAGVYTRASMYQSWLRSTIKDSFVVLSVNATDSELTDSSPSTFFSRWSLVVTLYIFTPTLLHI